MKIERIVARLAILLALAEAVLVLLSWLLAATMTEGVRTLLSADGVRWFFAHFENMIASPALAWLLLMAMAGGALWKSGLLQPDGSMNYKRGVVVVTIVLVFYAGAISWLILMPHAILLSATGRLWPSSFSYALLPICAFGTVICSISHGLVVRRFTSLTDVCSSLCYGISKSAPALFLYVLFIQFYESLRYVLYS